MFKSYLFNLGLKISQDLTAFPALLHPPQIKISSVELATADPMRLTDISTSGRWFLWAMSNVTTSATSPESSQPPMQYNTPTTRYETLLAEFILSWSDNSNPIISHVQLAYTLIKRTQPPPTADTI